MAKFGCIWTVFTAMILLVLLLAGGCRHDLEIDCQLDMAENLMEDRPDSSLSILEGIDMSELRGDRIKARYALLKSMALDKNYIDTTTFDVLQPAIDYYRKHGNADEKLRTYYYEGTIYDNAGDDDLAMQAYISGLEHEYQMTDSLTLARMLVAQGVLYYKQYRIEDLVENNLRAADIYGRLGKKPQQLKGLVRALNGGIIMSDKFKADSIIRICKAIVDDSPDLNKETLLPFLKYAIVFGTDEDIKSMIGEVREAGMEDDMNMTLARAYTKTGEAETGLRYLDQAKLASDNILDSLTYWSIKTEVLENMGEYKESLDAFRSYNSLLEKYHTQLFSNELLFSEKKHAMEIEDMERIRERDLVIKWILAGAAVLILIIVFIYYRYRMNKAGRIIAEGNSERLRLNNEKLQLEAENLHLQIGQLEGEREQLKELLDKQDTLSEEARQIIKERIALLNGLFAKALTDVDSYGREFQKYIVKIKKDKKAFQQSIGKVMETTHPGFMKYLKDRELTERETDYVCLYAIGLRGKEIGNYLDLARHYNISSDVRRKLGLDSNGSNLGPSIRELMDSK